MPEKGNCEMTTISVPMRDMASGKMFQVEVEAFFPTSSPCIAIHRTPLEADSPNHQLGFWTITHVPSGHSYIARLPNQEIASAVARWIAEQPLDHSGDFGAITASASPEFRRTVARMVGLAGDAESANIDLLKLAGVSLRTVKHAFFN